MSRPEALQYREACLKYTVKKSERHLLMDVNIDPGKPAAEVSQT